MWPQSPFLQGTPEEKHWQLYYLKSCNGATYRREGPIWRSSSTLPLHATGAAFYLTVSQTMMFPSTLAGLMLLHGGLLMPSD